jgi:hypothetical protein
MGEDWRNKTTDRIEWSGRVKGKIKMVGSFRGRNRRVFGKKCLKTVHFLRKV